MTDALVVSQHQIGTTVLGMATMESALKQGLEGTGVNASFTRLPRWSWWDRRRARPFAGGRTELDFHEFRWHLVESGRARKVLQEQEKKAPFDAVYVNTHSAGLRIHDFMQHTPTLLAVDCTVKQWSQLSSFARPSNYSEVAIRPSALLERRAFSAAAAVVAMSSWTADQVREASPHARCEVIHPGLDLSIYKPSAERAVSATRRVLFVGGRFRAKGGDDLLEAIGDRIGDDVACDVVTGDQVPNRAGLRSHTLTSGSAELIQLFQSTDVLVLPTYMDAVPWVVLEAMACGIPVVGSTVGASAELLDHGRCGVVVEPGDIRGLRSAIASVIDDPQRRDSLGAAGRSRAEADFDVRVQGRRLASLIDDVCGRPAT